MQEISGGFLAPKLDEREEITDVEWREAQEALAKSTIDYWESKKEKFYACKLQNQLVVLKNALGECLLELDELEVSIKEFINSKEKPNDQL